MHTQYSACSRKWGAYNIKDVYKVIKERGLDGFGTADHAVNYRYTHNFILQQKKIQEEFHSSRPLVGLEISIANRKGDLSYNPKLDKYLDFKIISEHVHVAKLFSGYSGFKQKFIKLMQDYPENQRKIEKMLDDLLVCQLNALEKHSHVIFAHLLRSPRSWGFYFTKLYDMAEKLIEKMQERDIVMELHSSFLFGLELDKEHSLKLVKGGDPGEHPLKFYEFLKKTIKKYSLRYSLGSDAHRLQNIIGKEKWVAFLKNLNIREHEIITPQYFLDEA